MYHYVGGIDAHVATTTFGEMDVKRTKEMQVLLQVFSILRRYEDYPIADLQPH
jgi:hypothetical protein